MGGIVNYNKIWKEKDYFRIRNNNTWRRQLLRWIRPSIGRITLRWRPLICTLKRPLIKQGSCRHQFTIGVEIWIFKIQIIWLLQHRTKYLHHKTVQLTHVLLTVIDRSFCPQLGLFHLKETKLKLVLRKINSRNRLKEKYLTIIILASKIKRIQIIVLFLAKKRNLLKVRVTKMAQDDQILMKLW